MGALSNIRELRKESITVQIFSEECKERFSLTQLNPGVGLDKLITDKNLHRPQLALAGYIGLFTFHRVQVLGNTEMFYLKSLSNENRINAFKLVASFDVPCFIIPNVNDFGQDLIDIATDQGIAVFTTPHETTKAIYLLTDFLDDQFSPYSPIHGSFIDVYGVGILFIGRSGIGKSEIALDLIERSHRLVADDVVMVTRKGEGILMGSGTKLTQHFMEVRGLGLLNVREMFGIRAIRFQKRVEVIVELEEWHPDVEYTRTGLDDNFTKILDVDIPYLKLPIFPGKNVTVIAEVISLNYLLKHYGYNAAKVFTEKLRESLKKKVEETDRSIHYFENDFE